ncbi:hypothetical protein Tco_1045965, partial [Tanacetum coccineum]
AYSDENHAACNDDCKRTSGGNQFLGDKLVSWSLKKQDCTAMSTAEAEYVSLSACCAQVIWMGTQLQQDFNEHVEKDTIEIYFVGTKYQLADLFTKALSKERFEYLVHKIVFHMAQQIIPAAQLVPKFQGIGRYNNYVVLQNAFFTDEIRATDDYKEYEMVFFGVDIPMKQPQPVVFTLGTHRTTPRAYMTPTLTAASPYGKKRKQGAGETSLPRKSLKVTIRRKKQSTPSIPPPSDDRERDKIDKATILSLTLHKAALAAEAQESNAKVQKSVEEGD